MRKKYFIKGGILFLTLIFFMVSLQSSQVYKISSWKKIQSNKKLRVLKILKLSPKMYKVNMKDIRAALKIAGVKETVSIFLLTGNGKLSCNLGRYNPSSIVNPKLTRRKIKKTAPIKTIPDYFEDPLTAFEDPLTAFEDPLTAFEDPLTAFEDPLTAFEDPLTAIKTGKTSKSTYKLVFKNSKGLTKATKIIKLILYSRK